MGVKVIFFGPLERWAGKREYYISGKSIGEVLERLSIEIGKSLIDHIAKQDTGEIKSHFHVLLNGIDTDSTDCLTISVKDGDSITIVPPIGGG